MGGNLAWTVRLQDGTEHRMDRWTNALPGLILDPDFLDARPEAIATALAPWLELRDDWARNRESGAFEYRMTPVYAPYPYGLKPSEYGIVVTCFRTRTLLSLQGYSHLDKLPALRQCFGPHVIESFPGRAEQVEKWGRARRLAGFRFLLRHEQAARTLAGIGGTAEPHADGTAWHVSLPGTIDIVALDALCDRLRDDVAPHPQAAEIAGFRAALAAAGPHEAAEREQLGKALDALESSHRQQQTPFLSGHAIPDLRPFTLETFPETAQGYAAMRVRLRALGFVLDAEEEAGWAERISQEKEATGFHEMTEAARSRAGRWAAEHPASQIHALEATTTECHAEAQTMCGLKENHDPGRIRCFPPDRP